MKKLIQQIGLGSLVCFTFMSTAQAAGVGKSSGNTTPHNADFSSGHLSYPFQGNKYNDPNQNRMFRETFKIKRCKVSKATFQIKLKRLGAQDNNDGLYFVTQGGAQYHAVRPIWSNQGPTSRFISYNFTPAALTKISNGRFSFVVEDDTMVQSATLKYECAGNNGGGKYEKGMTWAKKKVDPTTGVLTVGCQPSNGYKCDPYKGDQKCTVKHPMLCKRVLGLPKPNSLTFPSKYYAWSGNVVGTTNPVAPATSGINTKTKASQFCAQEFGKGWQVAGFHDAKYWNSMNYGNVGTKGKRFWVNIKDQASGNCWSQQ